MTITVEFDPPQPGDSREVFNNKAFDTVAKFNPWSQQANALALEVNNDAATAEAGAEIVNAVVNFRGAWDDLTGALSVPASCAHASGYWILLESVADVTAHEPGVSAVWAMYESDFARLSGADFTGPITVPAGASGSQAPRASEVALLAGAAFTGPITVPAGATGEQAVRASEAQWSAPVIVPASGSAVDITGVPSAVREIRIFLYNVEFPASSNLLLNLGHAGGIQETGYVANGVLSTPTASTSGTPNYLAFPIRILESADSIAIGEIRLFNSSSMEWSISGYVWSTLGDKIFQPSGRVTLLGILDRLRIKTQTGSFMGGSFYVSWRY